jgi:hypothetical protein
MCDIVWVDGSSGTVAAWLRRGVRSPRTIACPLHMSSRSAPYYHRPAASMSCTHLIPTIHCVWPITYAFNALPTPRAWRGHDEADVRHLGNARARPGPRPTRHIAAPEPSRTRKRVWSHRTCVYTGALPDGGPGASGHAVTPEPSRDGWHALCHETRGDTRTLPWRVARFVPWGTWRRRSPLLSGGALCVMGHVATPEPSPARWCTLCHGARGDTEALSGTGSGSGAVGLVF